MFQPVKGVVKSKQLYPLSLWCYLQRPQLCQSRELRHGPQQQLRSRYCYGLGGSQATYFSPILSFTSSDTLSTGHEPFCVSLSPVAHHTFAHYSSTCLPGAVRPRWASVFSLEPILAAWRGVRGVAGLELETQGCILVLSCLRQPQLMMQLFCSMDFLNKAESRC